MQIYAAGGSSGSKSSLLSWETKHRGHRETATQRCKSWTNWKRWNSKKSNTTSQLLYYILYYMYIFCRLGGTGKRSVLKRKIIRLRNSHDATTTYNFLICRILVVTNWFPHSHPMELSELLFSSHSKMKTQLKSETNSNLPRNWFSGL